MNEPHVAEACDEYLDYYKHSPESYQHVIAVLGRFDVIVTQATREAMGDLEIPLAKILAFSGRMTLSQELPEGGALYLFPTNSGNDVS